MSGKQRAVFALLAVTTLAVAIAATGWAVIGDGGVIKTCLSQAKGTWRPIDSSASCNKGETTLELYSRAAVDALVGALDTRVDDLEGATGGGGLTTASRRWQLGQFNQSGAPLVVGDYTVTPTCQFGGLSFAVERDSTIVGSAFYNLDTQSGTYVRVFPGVGATDTEAPLTLTVDVAVVDNDCGAVAVGQVAAP